MRIAAFEFRKKVKIWKAVDVASGGDCHKCHAFCSSRVDAEIEEDEEEA